VQMKKVEKTRPNRALKTAVSLVKTCNAVKYKREEGAASGELRHRSLVIVNALRPPVQKEVGWAGLAMYF